MFSVYLLFFVIILGNFYEILNFYGLVFAFFFKMFKTISRIINSVAKLCFGRGTDINSVISQEVQEETFPRQNETRKKYERLCEFVGLEISNELICDLADHEREKILYICTNKNCFAPRRMACGYCSSQYHADHP